MEKTLEDIYHSALKFLEPLSLQTTYQLIVSEASKLVGADSGSIFIWENKKLQRVYSTVPIKRQIIHSVILVPLSYKNQAVGVLSLQSKQKKYFNRDKTPVLKLYGALASMAIRKMQLYEETKKALASRDFFISLASHEIKTPLTYLSLYVQYAHNKFKRKEPVNMSVLENLASGVKRLTYLVNNMLRLNMITQATRYQWEKINLNNLLEKVISEYKLLHSQYNFLFQSQITAEPFIIGDKDKLSQVLYNLLNNSVKFSSEKSMIKFNLTNTRNKFHITVKDMGNGITKSDLPHIFEKYYKGKNHTKEGMGLGLYISKKIVMKHHGKINIESQPNKGTVVYLELPILDGKSASYYPSD